VLKECDWRSGFHDGFGSDDRSFFFIFDLAGFQGMEGLTAYIGAFFERCDSMAWIGVVWNGMERHRKA